MKTKTVLVALLLAGYALLLTYLQSIYSPLGFITETSYLSEPYDKKGFIKGGLYLSSYLISLAALLSILFIANKWVANLLIAYCAVLFGVDVFLQLLGSSTNGITVTLLSTAFNEVGRASDLLVYKTPLIYSGLITLGIFVLALVIRQLIPIHKRIVAVWSVLFLVLSIVGIGLLSHKIFSIKTQSYLAPIKAPLILREYLTEYRSTSQRILDLSIKPTQAAEYQTIIWIIDESISGDYLAVNGYSKPNTPFLTAFKANAGMQNYGTVASISNCSNTSNLFLRIGLNSSVKQDFKTAKNTLPTIFQYAKQAGFETSLIDAQIAPGEMQNNLTGQDLKFIDHNLAFPRTIHPKDRDQALVQELNKALSKQATKNRFIVAVKWGAHWPYSLAYPTEQALFQPAATESLTEMVVANQEILTNSYLNALHYSVDYFFQGLLAKPLQANQVIFYTSDHGQSLFEKQNSPITHCHYADDPKELPLGEFKVPLMIFSPEAKSKFPKLENRLYAQAQIFPSTLQLFGYDKSIYAAHGPTLMQGSELDYSEAYILDSEMKIKIPKTELK